MSSSFQADPGVLAVRPASEVLEFQRSRFVRLLRSLLVAAQSVLPKTVYEPLCQFSFRAYKGMLRVFYLRHVVYEAILGSRAARIRAQLVHQVMHYSLVGSSGLEATYDAAACVIAGRIPGDFVECGVAQGGCSALMATLAKADVTPRQMWLFDSFQGLPDPTKEDFGETGQATGQHIRPLPRGSCLGTKDEVQKLLFTQFGLSPESVFLVEGWFQDTLPVYKNRIERIGVLRIDGDWYDSTLCCLCNLYDRVSAGGYIIIDDYGTCFGCKKAVHEFLDSRGIRVTLIPDGRGGALFSKPA